MSTDREFTRTVRSWLHEDAHEDADRVLDLVLDQVDATPQRRTLWLARRSSDMNNNIVRIGLAAAAAVLVVILGVNYLSGRGVGDDPEATPTATAAPSTAVSPIRLPQVEAQPLPAGTYSLAASFPVGLTFEVPVGWLACSLGSVEQAVCQDVPAEDHTGVGVTFLIVDNVVADPCDPGAKLLDPPVGPSVDDLVTAISNLEGFEATAATDVTVDGFQGKQFTLTAPESADGCGLKTWATAVRTNGVGETEINEMRILEVDGVRLVINSTYFPQASEEGLSALKDVIASIQIEP